MKDSSLVSYICLSPNKSIGRKYSVTRITPHCSVCNVSVERLLNIFKPILRRASCNYGIGNDGKIGLCVNEDNRSWCSSSKDNDNRSITIEVASSNKYPYSITDPSYRSLINLMTDICQRYKKSKIIWIPDKNKALTYKLQDNEMLITVHRWFANKSCPGKFIYDHLGEIADEINSRLSGSDSMPDNVDPYIRYIVKKGDTLYRLSRRYDVPIAKIIEINNLNNPNLIKVGQMLLIPKH